MSKREDIIERYTKLVNRKKEGMRISKDRQVIGKQKDRATRQLSSHDQLKKRAYRAANKYIRSKYGRSHDFHKLSPQEKSAINQAIDRHDLTAMVAQRMMPDVQRKDAALIKSRTKEKKAKKVGSGRTKIAKAKKVKKEEFQNNQEMVTEVLTIAQRRKKAMSVRKNQKRMQRGRKIAMRKMADQSRLKKRAYRAARKIVRTKFASKKGANYASLSPSEKIAVDNIIVKKQNLIKKIAVRLIPKMRKQDQQRIASFTKGAALKGPESKKSVNEELNERFNSWADETGVTISNTRPPRTDKEKKRKNLNPKNEIIIYNKFKGEKKNESAIFKSLLKKAEKTGFDVELLGEVYNRGWSEWEEGDIDREQFAFNRVNSFIAGGQATVEDIDLVERALSDAEENKKEEIVKALKRKGGMPKDQMYAVATAQAKKVAEGKDPCWDDYKQVGTKKKNGKEVPNCVPEEVDLQEISKKVVKNYLLKKGSDMPKRTHNKEYGDRIKKQYGKDDPEVKQYDRFEKQHQSKVRAKQNALKRVPGYDHQKELEKSAKKTREIHAKYNYHQNTPKGSGYLKGHDPDKEDHVIIGVPTGRGVRSKSDSAHKEVSVHKKHLQLKEAREPSDAFRRAQKNLAGLKSGAVQRKVKHDAAMAKARKSAKANLIKLHKDEADHHLKKHNEAHAEYKEHDEVYKGIESDHKNYGFRDKEHARGGLEEVDGMRDRAAEKRNHHEMKFIRAKHAYEEASGKKYKGKLAESLEILEPSVSKIMEAAGYPSDGHYVTPCGKNTTKVDRHRTPSGKHYMTADDIGTFDKARASKLAKQHGGEVTPAANNKFRVKVKSLNEGKMKELAHDLENMDAGNFKKKYGKTRGHMNIVLNTNKKTNNSNAPFKEQATNHAEKHNAKVTKVRQRRELPEETKTLKDKRGVNSTKTGRKKYQKKYRDELSDPSVQHKKKKPVVKGNGLPEEVQLDEMIKIGTYTNKGGSKFTVHRHADDKNHHMLVHNGQVVDTFHGKSHDEIHNNLKKQGLTGAITKNVNEMKEKPKDREVGTDSLVNTYKDDTPGEGKKTEAVTETAKAADQEAIIIPAHRDAYGNIIPAKAVKRRTNRLLTKVTTQLMGKIQ